MKNKYFPVALLLCFAVSVSFAQSWIDMMKDPSVNFYDVQKAFNKQYRKYERSVERNAPETQEDMKTADESEEEFPGYMQYKRWEWFMEPRVYPSGDRSVLAKAAYEAQTRLHNASASKLLPVGNWTLLGPINTNPTGGTGAGRINGVAVDPTNPNIIYVGAPSGGLWKSTNGGSTWSTATDDLPLLGVTDIAIDPVNPQVIYIATGDGDHSDNYSAGVLKSSDGGATWNTTGISYTAGQNIITHRLMINPNNTNIVYVATNLGVYRSADAGLVWTRVLSASVTDMEFRPDNPDIVYASCSSGLYRSVNGGLSFSTINNGIPTTGVDRYSIAVTPADPDYLYVIGGQSSIHGFQGLYLSTNGGGSFTKQSNKPNLLGWCCDGSDSTKGGQSWYTLPIAVSPTNKNEVVVGGVNIWHSTNAGVTWSIIASQTGGSGSGGCSSCGSIPYVHADIHTLVYTSASTLYAGSDGGVFKSSNDGTTWSDLSNGLQIAQMYRIGCSATQPNVVIQGWQDNGTNKWSAGTWSKTWGGDGMECFIDWQNASYMYVEQNNGLLKRSTNGGASYTAITTGITEQASGSWVTPWCIDPKTPSTIYAGYLNLWKSTDRGTTWNKISNLSIGAIIAVAVAPSNPSVIYVAGSSAIYKTTDGGATWTNITTGTAGGGAITYIAVNGQDPNRLWITRSGYSTGKKVMKSVDGGLTWKDISYDIPGIPANCVVVDTSSSVEAVYVGTDLGVYYTDTTRSYWLPYSNGLPHVIVDELEIQYTAKKLRAATFGRGLWESNLYDPASLAPAANFTSDVQLVCPGDSVHFTDKSTNTPTAWNWSFPGANPSSSTAQNPVVSYTATGTYQDVKLVVTNGNGSDSVAKYSLIGISPALKPTTTPAGSVTLCGGTAQIYASNGTSYSWLPGGQQALILNANASGSYQVIVTDMFGCKDTSDAVNLTLMPALSTPTITASGDTLICNPTYASYQWYSMAGTPISGATGQTFVGTPGTSYYVVGTNAAGCTKQSTMVATGIREEQVPGLSMDIFPSPNQGTFVLDVYLTGQRTVSAEVRDMAGRLVLTRDLGTISGSRKETFALDLSRGVYFFTLKTTAGTVVKKFVVE